MLPISLCNFRQYVACWAASGIALNHNTISDPQVQVQVLRSQVRVQVL